MNIEEIDKWLKDQYGISYTEMGNEFNEAVERFNKYAKEVKRLNNIINEMKAILKSKGYETYIPVLEGSDKE